MMEPASARQYRLKKVVPVGSKKDPICSNTIHLSINKDNTFGRVLSEDVRIRLLSKNFPLMISRKHATISFSDDHAYVTDHNSINGVYVNGKRIPSEIWSNLNIGDTIAFGCSMGDTPCEFEFFFERNQTNSKHTRKKLSDAHSELTISTGSPNKRKCLIDLPTVVESNLSITKQPNHGKHKLKAQIQPQLSSQEPIDKTEQIGFIEFQESQSKKLVEKQLLEKESALREEFDKQIKLLQDEKNSIEKNLQNELCSKLTEKDMAYKQELEQQKLLLEGAMFDKENEKKCLIMQLKAKEGLLEKYKSVEENQKQLEECMDKLRKQVQDKDNQLLYQKEIFKKVECETKQNVIQTMEDEFTCIVCQELFIDAITLPCAHTFCEICLVLWTHKKKTCPVCRRKIKGKAIRSFVLDSAVEKMVESMDEETIKRRAELKKVRGDMKRRDLSVEGTNGLGALIHSVDDDTEEETVSSRSQRTPTSVNRHRQRSRSPRNFRHRPYHMEYRHSNNTMLHHQNSRAVSSFHNNRSYARYNNNFYLQHANEFPSHQNMHVHYAFNNNIRCFYCGGNGHQDRFCPRR